jgi:hypothetical protein
VLDIASVYRPTAARLSRLLSILRVIMMGASPLDYWPHSPFPDSSYTSSRENGFSSGSGSMACPLNV